MNAIFLKSDSCKFLYPEHFLVLFHKSIIKIGLKRGHSDSHQSKKDSDSHHAVTSTPNTEITLFYAARTETRLAPTTPRPAPNAARTTFAYSLTLRPARLAPAATRTKQRLAPFL